MFTAIKTVGEMGEFALIDRLQRILPKNLGETVIHGVGDDTAVIGIDDHRALLITCDIQVEDRHFRLKYISPYQLGQRAMAVNLSDIAAMGGTPTYALVSLGLPNSFPLNAYDQLFEGMKDELSIYSSAIVGGNLARTEDKLIIDITLLGEISRNQVITRSGAQEGDRIFVTGTLGA
ncbi:MAG: thiamine-phosphate kinase, partial [Gammaproteobacteria bacterium]|nr:thiamine-phosphate kinase [Gammaproteobacteria bacterium]